MTQKNTQPADFFEFIKKIKTDPIIELSLNELDQHDHHSSLICLCLWHPCHGGGKLSTRTLRQLISEFHHWQQSIVHNLSLLNQSVKNLDSETVKQDSQALVAFALEAGIRMLDDHSPPILKPKSNLTQNMKDGCFNISRYLKINDIPHSATLEKQLTLLCIATFPNGDVNCVKQTLVESLKNAKIIKHHYQQLTMSQI